MSVPASFSPVGSNQKMKSMDPLVLSAWIFVGAIALSISIHLVFAIMASRWSMNLQSVEDIRQPIETTLVNQLPVVQTWQQESKTIPRDPHFASDKNITTDQETSPERAPTNIATARQRQAQQSRSNSKEGEGKISKDFLTLNDLQSKSNRAQETVIQGQDKFDSTGFMERLRRGQEFKVNAAQFDYASYIKRMQTKLMQQWTPQKTISPAMYSYREVRVDIGVVLNTKGEIVDLRTTQNSVFSKFDDEARRALREAGPFPNPPKSLIQDDKFVYMPWAFVLTMDPWGVSRDVE